MRLVVVRLFSAFAAVAAVACAKGADEAAGDLGDSSTSAPDDATTHPIDGAPVVDDGAAPDVTVDAAQDAGGDVADATVPDVVDAADAGCDAATPAHIPLAGTDTFQLPVDPRWAKVGSADLGAAVPGWARLTTATNGQAGAAWWNASYTFDHFDVTFQFKIDNNPNGADGLAFAWVPGSDVTKIGGGGGGYGMGGLGGWGVAIDTYQNPGDPAVPFLTVVDSNVDHLTNATIPNVRDGNAHAMRVALQSGSVSVWIDGTAYVTAYALPAYAPFVGHWGFTAATGGNSEAHLVTGIAMTFPDGQGCPTGGD